MKSLRVFLLAGLFCLTVSGSLVSVNAQTDKSTDSNKTPKTINQSIIPDKKIGDQSIESDEQVALEKYRIGFQDTIEVQVARHSELSITTTLDSDGTIRLPRLDNPVNAACKTEQELAKLIADAYRRNYLRDPFVNVRAVEQKSQSFAVIGEVEKPGSFYVNRRIRLLELLAFAGGPKQEAGSNVIVARTGSSTVCREKEDKFDENAEVEIFSYKIKDIQQAKENLWMKPGDIVSVLKSDMVYVYGNFKKKEAIRLDSPKTLLQVIAEAEGLDSTAKKDKVRVLRQVEGKAEREETVYNLKDIEAQKAPDPFLQPNDIVAVSEDGKKKILQAVTKTFQQGIGTLFYRIP